MAYRTSIGLDVHARSVAAAAFIPETGEVLQKSFPPDPWAIAEWARSMPQPAKRVYESGPTGFDLQRKLAESGVECCVGAVSKMLRPSGDRVKTDRRDAVFLARMLAVGNIVEVAVPTPAMEAARDLSRAREDCRHDLMRARHLLSKFLLRKGVVYPGRCAWTKAHGEWLASLAFDDPCERLVFEEYLEAVRSLELRRQRLDEAIAGRASRPDLAPTVEAKRAGTIITTLASTTSGGARASAQNAASVRRSSRASSRTSSQACSTIRSCWHRLRLTLRHTTARRMMMARTFGRCNQNSTMRRDR